MIKTTFKIYYSGFCASIVLSYMDYEQIENVDFDGESLLIEAFCEEYKKPLSGYFLGRDSKDSIEYYSSVLHRMTLRYEGLEYVCENYPEIETKQPEDEEGLVF